MSLDHDLSRFVDAQAGIYFGAVDAMKLRSSLTLFGRAGDGASLRALDRWFGAPIR